MVDVTNSPFKPRGKLVQLGRRQKKNKTTVETILCLGIYLKKTETPIQKDTRTPMFTVALFTIAKLWKQPRCPCE